MFYDNYVDKEMIEHIEYVRGLYELQKEKVESETYIQGLLLDDYIRAIRKINSWYCVASDFFSQAQREMNEKKKKQEYLTLLKERIKQDFLSSNENFELVGITSFGYENYAWQMDYTGYDKEFAIIIPIVKKITTENMRAANYGKYAFTIKTGHSSWKHLKVSYKPEDIADFIREYFQTEKAKEEEE